MYRLISIRCLFHLSHGVFFTLQFPFGILNLPIQSASGYHNFYPPAAPQSSSPSLFSFVTPPQGAEIRLTVSASVLFRFFFLIAFSPLILIGSYSKPLAGPGLVTFLLTPFVFPTRFFIYTFLFYLFYRFNDSCQFFFSLFICFSLPPIWRPLGSPSTF